MTCLVEQPQSAPVSTGSRTITVLDARVVTGSGGGPEKTILNSPRYLTKSGYRMLCAYMHNPSDEGFVHIREKALRYEAPLLPVSDRGFWDWRVVRDLLRICKEEQVAVWHGHDYKSNLIGLILNRFWPMKLVTTLHGWVQHTPRTPLYYAIDRFCLPHYDVVISVSEDLFAASRACGVSADRCSLIHNGIDLTEFTRRTSVAEAKRHLGISPETFLIGAAGRLSPEKGFDVLLRAVRDMPRNSRPVALLIAGQGDELGRLRALADELGLASDVRFLGYQPNLFEMYQALDVFALSSIREGLPNVLLEAMALEVPVVSTRIAGIPRLIRNGESGLLVEPNNQQELTNALVTLAHDPDARARYARAGRRTIEDEFSFAARMQKIRGVYDTLLLPN